MNVCLLIRTRITLAGPLTAGFPPRQPQAPAHDCIHGGRCILQKNCLRLGSGPSGPGHLRVQSDVSENLRSNTLGWSNLVALNIMIFLLWVTIIKGGFSWIFHAIRQVYQSVTGILTPSVWYASGCCSKRPYPSILARTHKNKAAKRPLFWNDSWMDMGQRSTTSHKGGNL